MASDSPSKEFQQDQSSKASVRNIIIAGSVDHGRSSLLLEILSPYPTQQEEVGKKLRVLDQDHMTENWVPVTADILLERGNRSYKVHVVDILNNGSMYLGDNFALGMAIDSGSRGDVGFKQSQAALFVVDCIEGNDFAVNSLIPAMIARGVKPLLHLSKIDRLFLELGLRSEEVYQTLERHIYLFNTLLARAQPPDATEEISVSVFDGSVSFGSSKYGWAFTLPQIARSFVVSNGSSYEKILPLLWGDNFFDRFISKVVPYSHTANGKAIRFCNRVLFTPFIYIFKNFGPESPLKIPMTDVQKKFLTLCNVPMTDDQWSSFTTARERLKYFLSRWMPLKEAVAEQVLTHTKDSQP